MIVLPHPDAERLTAYLLGKLSWPEAEQVESHLDACPDCRAQTGILEGCSDSFVSGLRGVETEPGDDPAMKKLVAGAVALAQTTPGFSAVEPATTPGVSAAAPARLEAGHELLYELARGGLGVVFLARHPVLGDLRAIKRPLPREDIHPAAILARFRREVQAVGSVRHNHVIRAHDAGTDAAGPYLVMEYLDGESLSGLETRHGPLPTGPACEMVRQAALGLQAAHERGLVHRDVKPSNLMLARANSGSRVVVIDWGLVKRTNEAVPLTPQPAELTGPGTAMGTPDYIAPEQVHDASSVDIRADVYSLGVTLYCLLAGKPPFQGRANHEKLLAHEREPFPPLDRFRSDLSRELLAVLGKMVEKNPARRYATPGEAATALWPFCCDESQLLPLLEGPQAKPEPPTPTPTFPGPRRRWRFFLLPMAGASVLLGAVAFGLMQHGKSSPVATRAGGDPGTEGVRATESIPAVLGDGPATPVSMIDHPGHCSSLAFTTDGLHAFSESGGGGIYFWDLRNRRLEKSQLHGFQRPDKNQKNSGVVGVSPDGNYVLAAAPIPPFGYMNQLSLSNQKTCEPIKAEFAIFYGTMGHAVAISPHGSDLIATEDLPGLIRTEPKVRVLKVPSGAIYKEFLSKSPVGGFAFSPDGQILAIAGNEKTIRLRHLEADRQEREFKGHAAPADQIAFSTDGTRFFSASRGDGTLRVWNNQDAGEVVEKESIKIEVDRTLAKMTCTAFWPGGRALTGHVDGSVVLWDLTTGEELQRFRHKDAQVTAVAISPDGQHALAAVSPENLVYLSRLPPPRAGR